MDLSKIAGVEPSPEWLEKCRSFLSNNYQNSNHSNNINDEILHQILHSDLRHVVRSRPYNNSTSSASISSSSSNSIVLRQSISKSSSPPEFKAVLPSSFRLMVQIEELVDVSLSAEERWKNVNTTSNNSSTTNIGNQIVSSANKNISQMNQNHKQCLKLLFSDGYFSNGQRVSQIQNDSFQNDIASSLSNNHGMIGMETYPIPNLNSNSLPGIKVLLTGPITIRSGILMLDPSNAFVMGGFISSLIPIRNKAIEKAAKAAGVGIDPTVKALIWNPLTGSEQDADEGEQESSDVQQQVSTSLHTRTIDTSNHQTNQITNSHDNNNVNNSIGRPIISPPSSTVSSTIHLQNNNTSNTNLQTVTTRPLSNNMNVSPYTPSLSASSRNNTYSSTTKPPANSFHIHKHSNTTATITTTNPYAKRNLQQTENSTRSITPTPNRNENHSNHTTDDHNTTINLSKQSLSPHPSNNYLKSTSNILSSSSMMEDAPKTNDTFQSTNHVPLLDLSPTALSEPLSFTEFKALLQSIKSSTDQQLKYTNTIFVVPCKMHTQQSDTSLGFNVIKCKNRKKKGNNERYQYVMSCDLTGTRDNDGVITCKIANNVIEPYIGISPTSMREKYREDKVEANRVATKGCTQIFTEFQKLASCHFKLISGDDKPDTPVSANGENIPSVVMVTRN